MPCEVVLVRVYFPPKSATHYGGYSYKISWRLMKGIQKIFKSPYFVSMATAAKFVQPIPRVTYCYSTFLFHYYYYYSSSTHFCPLDFSEMPWSNFMKPCRNIICYVKFEIRNGANTICLPKLRLGNINIKKYNR
jgi:hypothetical protein